MSTTSSQDSSPSHHSASTVIEPVVSTPRRLYTRAGRAAAAAFETITTPFNQAEWQNRLQQQQIQALYSANNYSSSDEDSIASNAHEDAESSDNENRRGV